MMIMMMMKMMMTMMMAMNTMMMVILMNMMMTAISINKSTKLTHSIAITKTQAELGERVPSISRPLEIQHCLDGILGHSRVE